MRWTRPQAGRYDSGPYTVEQKHYLGVSGAVWTATGPGLDDHARTCAVAKTMCENHMKARLSNGQAEVVPVVGDRVELVNDERTGVLTASFDHSNGTPTTYCIRLSRGRRTVVLRDEFLVVAS